MSSLRETISYGFKSILSTCRIVGIEPVNYVNVVLFDSETLGIA